MVQRDHRNLNDTLGNMLILKILAASSYFFSEIVRCNLKCTESSNSWMEETWQEWQNYPYYQFEDRRKQLQILLLSEIDMRKQPQAMIRLRLVLIRWQESIYIESSITQHKEHGNVPQSRRFYMSFHSY